MEVDSESRAARTCFRIATKCRGLAYTASEEWEMHHCTTGIIFVAFSIEAMINHFGQIMFKSEWGEIERKCRKDRHKILFTAVNLPNYLGSKNYQIARECLINRDLFAHGKTEEEPLNIEVPPNTPFKDLLYKISDEPTSMERIATIENLDKYIEIALKIQEDIQEHGYYPDQDHIPQEKREKLLESPLTVQGVRGCHLI